MRISANGKVQECILTSESFVSSKWTNTSGVPLYWYLHVKDSTGVREPLHCAADAWLDAAAPSVGSWRLSSAVAIGPRRRVNFAARCPRCCTTLVIQKYACCILPDRFKVYMHGLCVLLTCGEHNFAGSEIKIPKLENIVEGSEAAAANVVAPGDLFQKTIKLILCANCNSRQTYRLQLLCE